jgi:hypothetical protein
VKTFLTNSLARLDFDGFENKTDLRYGYKSTWRFSKDEVNSRYPNIPQDPQGYKKMKKQEDIQWSPPMQRQEGIDHWLLGLTCALVVRKRRGLSRQIWHAYQYQSINALVYHHQRTASSRLKVYANIRLQGAAPRSEDSIEMHEGRSDSKPTRATREAMTLQDPDLQLRNPLTLVEYFWAY